MKLPKRSMPSRLAINFKKSWSTIPLAALLVATPFISLPAQASNPALCAQGASLNFVAHADDDLIFMNPDIQRDIDNKMCVRTVVITAGDAGLGLGYAEQREAGSRAAYAAMAGLPNEWTVNNNYVVNGHRLWLFALKARPSISLVYMRINDGNLNGSGFAVTGNTSLKKLWEGSISSIKSIDTIPEYKQTYTKANLATTLADFIMLDEPEIVRGMDAFEPISNAGGHSDHADHMAAGYFVQRAERESVNTNHYVSYRGYTTNSTAFTNNVTSTTLDRKWNTFLTYAKHDPWVCQTRSLCTINNNPYGIWMSRQYDRGRRNVAPLATATASSQNTAGGQGASKAIDGQMLGYPIDSTKEWSTTGGKAGSWINLAWKSQQVIDKVVLYDRPNGADQVLSGTLQFSDGSSIAIKSLYNNGTPTLIAFDPKTTTSVRFTINSVSGTTQNIGLAELEAVTTNIAADTLASASSQNTAGGQGAAKAVDGFALGYPADSLKEWATVGGKTGSWITLNWTAPRNISSVVLFDRPNTDDRILSGDLIITGGPTIKVGALPNNGAPLVVSLPGYVSSQRIQFKVTSVSATTQNVGLAEIQVHDGAYLGSGL